MPPTIPAKPKIYHITHVDNLPAIVQAGVLWSDAERVARRLACTVVGLSTIKERRLHELEVDCHPGTKVGDYVPFYFCPRAIMLYILHMGNHPELTYRGGQGPIVHLEADLTATTDWADQNGVRWAFSDRNAGAYLARFHSSMADLGEVDWSAVAATDFRDPVVKEGKQAEFLVHGSFPWHLVESVGVSSASIRDRVVSTLPLSPHQPPVTVKSGWYF